MLGVIMNFNILIMKVWSLFPDIKKKSHLYISCT